MKYQEICDKLKDDCKQLELLCEKYKDKSKYKDQYNIFKLLNFRENSHSALFKWLINAKDKEKNSLQYLFLKEFINFLIDMEYIETDDVEKFTQIISSDLKMENCACKTQNKHYKQMDICFSSNNANFVCAIENKLDAKINKDNKTNKTQLEYYSNHINENFLNHKKLLIYLCANSNLNTKTDKILQNCN